MKIGTANPTPSYAPPIRVQRTGWLALVVFVLASFGYAFHTHGRLGSAASSKHAVSAAELTPETCPLCVAMQSAQASGLLVLQAFGTWTRIELKFQGLCSAKRPTVFFHFSRPPPPVL